jgi:hypothetical protein
MTHMRPPLTVCFATIIGALGGAGTGCASQPRFRDQPIVWRADDQRSIPEPEEREYLRYQYFGDLFLLRRSERALELRDRERAHNANALGEVPNSSWFENRIGVRDLSPRQAALGPAVEPAPSPPYVIKQGKVGGGRPGFIAEDASGRMFIIKFDTPENPEMQTGGNIVVNRIFWAAGYHVPADYVFTFRRQELAISPKATAKNDLGDKIPYTEAILDAALATAPRRPDGSFRATASQFLDGIPKGGFSAEGTRDDDPNDVVPHEHRRELRGLRVLSAWLNHSDMKEDNTLDMYVEHNGRRFLRHYFLDFGEALGGHAAEKNRKEDGWEHYWDWQNQPKALLAFGLWVRPWEGLTPSPYVSIGLFSAERFHPERWRVAYPYWPFFEMDAEDAYWGAKIVMRFDRSILEAIVAEARFSEPGAAEYLVDTLIARRDIIGRAYFEDVTPFDWLDVKPGILCGVDLSVHYGLAAGGVLERVSTGDEDDVLERHAVAADGRVCIGIPESDSYVVRRLRIARGSRRTEPMQVHLVAGERPRILGVVRVEGGS